MSHPGSFIKLLCLSLISYFIIGVINEIVGVDYNFTNVTITIGFSLIIGAILAL